MKRLLCLLVLTLLLVGCAGEKGIIGEDGCQLDTRRRAQAVHPHIRVLVIYYTADDFNSFLATLIDKNVSLHYLIPAVPPLYHGKLCIWQLASEEDLAWYAGVSFWHGTTRTNDIPIGIESEDRDWQRSAGSKYFAPFKPTQVQALILLARDIIAHYDIKPQSVMAHIDITSQHKDDSGSLFSWQALTAQGVGAWSDVQRVALYLVGRASHTPVKTASLPDLLSRYGYEVKPEMMPREQQWVTMASQVYFRPTLQNGVADVETRAIAEALLGKYGQG